MRVKKLIPPACFPVSTTATRSSASNEITSTEPASPPIPSTDIKAYLLSELMATPCETRLELAI